jgi:hypothetical protein
VADGAQSFGAVDVWLQGEGDPIEPRPARALQVLRHCLLVIQVIYRTQADRAPERLDIHFETHVRTTDVDGTGEHLIVGMHVLHRLPGELSKIGI